MAKITYDNKETLNSQPSIADKNKVTSSDMNEIKSVVNTNYGEVGDITNLTTTDKTSVVNAINELKGNEVYSTTEVKTNGVWTNGKPIYRRILTVNTTTTTGSATNLVQTPYIDTLISCYHSILAGNLIYLGSSPVSLYYNPSTKYFQESHSETWWNNRAITMILEYTKTKTSS